jgi:ElaB/YqjD/DUF883 family membrane-anchored ribosome-binding protein
MSAKVSLIEAQVRGTVDEKVEQVQRATDLRHLIADHPWQAMAVAVIVGYLIGRR